VTRRVRVAVLGFVPLAIAATDPRNDVGSCGRIVMETGSSAADRRIDIVAARGETVEHGTALRFTVTFAERLEVPDVEGTPFRVDILLRDPDAPAVSFRYYRDVNRIIRYDALPDALAQILLLPERGTNVFAGITLERSTLTVEVPGRLVRRDRDLEGLGLRRLRWTVVARDESECDVLGDGATTERVERSAGGPSSSAPPTAPDSGAGLPPRPSSGAGPWIAGALLGLGFLGVVFWAARRGRASSPPEIGLRSATDRGDDVRR
jgi:hypothetical protein